MAVLTLLVLLSIPLPALAAEPAAGAREPGDLWEVTSQMSMEGLPMSPPPQTVKVCSPKEWKEPPGGADERHKCKATDMKTEGNKVSWKAACAGPPPMTGTGEITRESADSFSGAIKMAASEGGGMTIKLAGKRLGDCEVKK
jgi:hypothetical protein